MVNHVPAWLSKSLKLDDLSAVAAAIRNAEVKTSAEIVPVVVKRSSVYGSLARIPPITGLVFLGILYLAGEYNYLPIHVAFYIAVGLFVVDAVMIPLSRTAWALRTFTPEADLDAQTRRRAELEFYQAGLNHTKGGTGILLFLSLHEHEAIVLADKSINDLLPPQTWVEVCKLITDAARNKQLGDGLVAAITRCGELAQPHFPPVDSNPNELKDKLIIKE